MQADSGRPHMLRSNQLGRGQEPVTGGGRTRSRGTVYIPLLSRYADYLVGKRYPAAHRRGEGERLGVVRLRAEHAHELAQHVVALEPVDARLALRGLLL